MRFSPLLPAPTSSMATWNSSSLKRSTRARKPSISESLVRSVTSTTTWRG